MTQLSPSIQSFIDRLPKPMQGVHSEQLDLGCSFVDILERFADENGTIALLSGGEQDSARYSILGIRPWLSLREAEGTVVAEFAGQQVSENLDAFDALDAVMERYRLQGPDLALPLSAGLLGYLSYDLKDCLEVLPRTSCDDLHLPRLYMAAPSILVVHDRRSGSTSAFVPIFDDGLEAAQHRLAQFKKDVHAGQAARDGRMQVGRVTSGLSRREYIEAVEAIRDYIARGHVYQVNMTQRYEAEFSGDAFILLKSLFEANPAPFFAFVQAGDHQIVSTSPERFIQLSNKQVETRPIKGTRARGATPEQDLALRNELMTSTKDEAELSMIVDLLRNDIGKVCAAQSVRVVEHKRVEAYQNVYHLVSIVVGELDHDKNAVDLIRATFPGGSITGCPKIRSMEIIDELEPVRRHVYTGSIGFLGFHGDMDLSIAIRTVTISGGRLVYSVGGGVIYDSVGADEYEETLHKGRTISGTLERWVPPETLPPQAPLPGERIGWCNGKFKRLSEIAIPVESEGFAYGYGFFETIRVQNGRPLRLEAHLRRFKRAWDTFCTSPFPDVTWKDVIDQVVARNGLEGQVAAVKLMAAAGKPGDTNGGMFLLVTARAYKHRLDGTARDGLRLAVYPQPWQTPLADHKTSNYMFQRVAAQWAHDQQADEAVILTPERKVSETNSANLLCKVGGKIVRPLSEHALPGTMEQAVCDLLGSWGIPVEQRALTIEELKQATCVMMTNALIGAVPITAIDGTPVQYDRALCDRINEALFA